MLRNLIFSNDTIIFRFQQLKGKYFDVMASNITNGLHNGDSDDICVYYYEHSSPSRKVLIALLEKNLVFRRLKIDLIKREQHERWYLEKVSKLCVLYID